MKIIRLFLSVILLTYTISDPEKLKNLVLAGTYIRPFTVDMMVTYKF